MRARGFTLIELLVAITVMAVMALISWRGIEGMATAREHARARADAVLTLQTTLAQWGADLDAMTELPQTRAFDWNGHLLRLTRQSGDTQSGDVFVVAWASDGRTWWRWQSMPVSTRAGWQQAWDAAASWMPGSNVASATALIPIEGWQLYAFRDNAWGPVAASSTLPAAGTAAAAIPAAAANANTAPADGLRLVLDLAAGPGLQGSITRDWLRPAATLARSPSASAAAAASVAVKQAAP
jgi:general secretion pathway protein J